MTVKTGPKINFFITCIAVLFFILVARLYYLQIIHGDAYLQRSESNFIQERVIKHSRGRILDSDGVALADNRLAYDVYITFAMLPDSIKNLKTLSSNFNILKKDLLSINQEVVKIAENSSEDTVILKKDISYRDCLNVLEIARVKMISGVEINKLAKNGRETCDVFIRGRDFPSPIETLNHLKFLLGIDQDNLLELWQKAHKKSLGLGRFKPHLLVADIGFDAYARIENAISLGKLSGITVVPSQRRRYVYKDLATHVVGLLNQVSISDIGQHPGVYRSGDFIGRNGIEAAFEDTLRGQDGVERVVVDAKGRRFDEAREDGLLGRDRIIDPVSGASARLSIDTDLQAVAQEHFLGLAGSVVVTEVDTGFILAMASFPNFDPNVLVSADNAKFFKELLSDKLRPLRNKAVQDHYSPGSIFKPMTAMAGLSRKLITPSSSHYCSGSYQIHKTVWRCFKREGHGPLNMVEALKVSCDSYFYELGHRMGLDALSEVALGLGFGRKTDIDLVGETAGILPSKEYYKKRFGYVAPGFVVNMSIGQGDLSVSPVQMAMAYGAIANGGTVYKPQLVKEIINEQGDVVKKFEPVVKSRVTDSSFNFGEILHGLSFVTEPGGSAHGLRYKPEHADIANWIKNEHVTIVGKTGTAQVVKLSKLVKHVDPSAVPYEHRDHAWFVAVYPKEAPKIVVVVMTEHAMGTGGAISAPVAARVMKKWHEKNLSLVAASGG
jgi:penicillin-binding protein 2